MQNEAFAGFSLGARASRPASSFEGGSTVASKGWHSRGYLPHLDAPGLVQSVTFRLGDSLPQDLLARWKEVLRLSVGGREERLLVEMRRRIERFEDAGAGACHLRDARVAELVQNALLHFDSVSYRLLAWCVMPNHVHVLIEQSDAHSIGAIVRSWKSYTARRANAVLRRSGSFWMEDYHDRYIRDGVHFARARAYIEANPVKARLVATASEWRFSSAYRVG